MLSDTKGWESGPQFYMSYGDDIELMFDEEEIEYYKSKTPPVESVRECCFELIYKALRVINLKDHITVVDFDKKCIFTGKDFSGTQHLEIGVLINIKKDTKILKENRTGNKLWDLIEIYEDLYDNSSLENINSKRKRGKFNILNNYNKK